MDKRQCEAGSLAADVCRQVEQRREQTNNSETDSAGMGREQMCSFVRVVNMTHSTLKMAEGHREL